MAVQLGVSRNTITNYEHDRNEVGITKLVAWATATGTDVAWLVEGDDQPSRSRCFSPGDDFDANQQTFAFAA
jgi:transcriptional regulator with XRE-family HTH domain